ncbi:MAG: D-galactarate dehydratase, partial [Acidobacteria bacterium]
MRIQRAAPYIRVHERDNVAIVIDPNGLRAGTQLPSGL